MLAFIGVVAAAVFLPLVLGAFWVSLLSQMLIFGLLALSVDLLTGHTGILPMGHAAFFAIAAYATAIVATRHSGGVLVSALAGVAASAIAACLFGLSVRTTGVYFILLTLALGHLVWGLAMRWTSFTGGENGISNIPLPPALGWAFYYLVLVVVLACAAAYALVVRSPFGLALHGIRESDSRMRGLGYNVFGHKYTAFVMSGVLAGTAGVLYAYWNRFVSPAAATFQMSAEAVLMVILGGSGTVAGPFVGAGVILLIRNWFSGQSRWWMAVMGFVFIASVMVGSRGLVNLVKTGRAQLMRAA